MVQPFEALKLEIPATPEIISALEDLFIAVNGFYYTGLKSDAIVFAIAWLRTQPDICSDLGLGKLL